MHLGAVHMQHAWSMLRHSVGTAPRRIDVHGLVCTLMFQDISDLRKTLNSEVDSLHTEFVDLKAALQNQLELTQGLSTTQQVSSMH